MKKLIPALLLMLSVSSAFAAPATHEVNTSITTTTGKDAPALTQKYPQYRGPKHDTLGGPKSLWTGVALFMRIEMLVLTGQWK